MAIMMVRNHIVDFFIFLYASPWACFFKSLSFIMLTIKFPESCVNFIAYDSRRGRVTKLTFCFNICKSKFDLFFALKREMA